MDDAEKSEVQSRESLKIGEPLPPEYDAVLNEVVTNSKSDTFIKQAREAIYYFAALDSGKELFDAEGNAVDLNAFVDMVVRFPFIRIMFLKFGPRTPTAIDATPTPANTPVVTRRTISMGNPSDSFPEWIVSKSDFTHVETDQGYPQLQSFYKNWSEAHKVKAWTGRYGIFSTYPREETPEMSDRFGSQFKGYVEVETEEAKLQEAFTKLAELKLHPHETKLFENSRMVLYWMSEPSPELAQKIKAVFAESGVPFRGPGQDSKYIKYSDDELTEDTAASNDQTLGEGGAFVEFRQESFDKTVFLKKYLQQMYRFWRNPVNPYELSFEPFINLQEGEELPENASLQVLQERSVLEVVPLASRVPMLFPGLR